MESAESLWKALIVLGEPVWHVTVLASTGSTNADLKERVRAGKRHRYEALIALEQTAGRGRLERSWVTAPGAGLAMSLAVPLPEEPRTWGLVPLAAGVAVVRAAARFGVRARLKWPNDVMVGDAKLAGILVETDGSTAIIGIGVNVRESGFPGAASLATAGVGPGLAEVAAAVMHEVRGAMDGLPSPAGRVYLLESYRKVCDTLGRRVRVYATETDWVDGEAVGITDLGELVVWTDSGLRSYASGDVFHLRTPPPSSRRRPGPPAADVGTGP